MIGSRPFSEEEISDLSNALAIGRDRCLFNLLIYTGFRIKEILSLTVKDVMKNGDVCERVTVRRINMKGKIVSRNVLVKSTVRVMLHDYIKKEALKGFNFLFKSQKGFNQPISRQQAWRILKAVAENLDGKISLHSTRKTFAKRMYEHFKKDLLKTKEALGHKNVNSTISYLSFDTGEIDDAIESW